MAFTVEDGTGVADANSYVTIAEAAAHFQDLNDEDWADADLKPRQAALIKATQYLEATYTWVGTKKTKAQALGWPRSGAEDKDGFSIDSTIVPQKVKDAVFFLAKEALTSDLLPARDRGGAVKSARVKVDVLEIEDEYLDSAPSETTYRMVDRMLTGLVEGSAGGFTRRLLRA